MRGQRVKGTLVNGLRNLRQGEDSVRKARAKVRVKENLTANLLQEEVETTAEIAAETGNVAVTAAIFATTADAEDSTVTPLASSRYWSQSGLKHYQISVC